MLMGGEGDGYFNPLPPQGGRRYYIYKYLEHREISIHSLPKEGDDVTGKLTVALAISIHSLPKEGDSVQADIRYYGSQFQSTPSPRRETYTMVIFSRFDEFQSTPSPRRETMTVDVSILILTISIHSLPKEGDSQKPLHHHRHERFQSTPSPRRETDIFCG